MSFERVDYELALAQSFWDALSKLDAAHQRAVNDAISKLRRGHNVHEHKLEGLAWVSFYVNRDALRVICHREGDTLVLCYVDLHKPAYDWAARNTFKQFGKAIRIARTIIEDDVLAIEDAEDVAPPGPLAAVKDKAFRLLEIPPGLAQGLRALPDEDAVIALCERVDGPLAEALLTLASDPDAVFDIAERYKAARGDTAKGKAPALHDAISADINAQTLWQVPPEHRALEEALKADSASWRVFLHPSQKRLVTKKTSGPMLVTGGPGTGKTVVALHRARVLAERYPHGTVLVTTFSRVLAAQLKDGVSMVCRDAPALAERIVVRTLVETAREVLKGAGLPHALLTNEDTDAAWQEVLREDPLDLGRAFYASERERVLLAHDVESEDAYLRVSRAGRGERLDRAQKRKVWSVLARFEEALVRRGGDDAAGLARRAAALLRAGKLTTPYVGVVCDEVQDASAYDLRLLAALAPTELFLVGDGHQRLRERPVSLRACGVEVRGRSSRLKLNYRTTQGICAAALELLDGLEEDVLDTDATADGASDLDGYRSVRGGARPVHHVCKSGEDEAELITNAIRATQKRPFLVLARTKKTLTALTERLRARGVTCTQLEDADAMPEGDHVVLATLLRSKGLECPHVWIAQRQEVPLRFVGGKDGSDEEKAQWQRKERLLLYVGMTRARDVCTLSSVKG